MKRDDDPYCECGLPLLGLDRIERERHRMGDRHLRRMAESDRDRLREAARRVASAYMAGGDIGEPLNDLCDAAGLLQQGDPPTNALPKEES